MEYLILQLNKLLLEEPHNDAIQRLNEYVDNNRATLSRNIDKANRYIENRRFAKALRVLRRHNDLDKIHKLLYHEQVLLTIKWSKGKSTCDNCLLRINLQPDVHRRRSSQSQDELSDCWIKHPSECFRPRRYVEIVCEQCKSKHYASNQAVQVAKRPRRRLMYSRTNRQCGRQKQDRLHKSLKHWTNDIEVCQKCFDYPQLSRTVKESLHAVDGFVQPLIDIVIQYAYHVYKRSNGY